GGAGGRGVPGSASRGEGGRAGGRGVGAAGGRGARKRDEKPGDNHDLWDDGSGWIDDEGAGPAVLD
ncbi:MAG: hypothetical protein L0H31_08115, partial [Nocardioidaceae bacterium]|nr:hypothetical protein [Nocardioidaceae bacterium]